MNQFVQDVWAGPSSLDMTFSEAPGVPFTVEQLAHALASIPGTKACAKPFTPGVVWRQHASFLAPLIFAKLNEWWACNPPPNTYFMEKWMAIHDSKTIQAASEAATFAPSGAARTGR